MRKLAGGTCSQLCILIPGILKKPSKCVLVHVIADTAFHTGPLGCTSPLHPLRCCPFDISGCSTQCPEQHALGTALIFHEVVRAAPGTHHTKALNDELSTSACIGTHHQKYCLRVCVVESPAGRFRPPLAANATIWQLRHYKLGRP